MVYVDDCLFFSRSEKDIDKIIEKIQSNGMDLHKEHDVPGFLSVLVEQKEDGSVLLSQTGLIDRIITARGLDHTNSKCTPAPLPPLGLDCIEFLIFVLFFIFYIL